MGASNMGASNSTQGEEVVFRIRNDVRLNDAQVQTLNEYGQRQGQGFLITAEGLKPPIGRRAQVKITNNLVSIDKSSIKLTVCDTNKFGVEFKYDSQVAARLMIFFDAKDKSGSHVQIVDPKYQIGPIALDSGIGMQWSSIKNEDITMELDLLPSPTTRKLEGTSENYDVIISLSCVSTNSAHNQQSTKTVRSLWSGVSYKSVGPIDNTELTDQNNMTKSEVTLIRRVLSNRSNDAIQAPANGEALPINIICQYVEKEKHVYLINDIYGMEARYKPKSDESSDVSDCVVCLSEPRVYALYPCRHLCLCHSCSMSITTNGNKCPICRQVGDFLLHFPIDEATQNGFYDVVPPTTESSAASSTVNAVIYDARNRQMARI